MDVANVKTSSAIESDSGEVADEETLSQDTVDPEEIELSDSEEIVVEETLIQVTTNNPDDMFSMNANSNVRVIAVDSNSPILQIENKVAFVFLLFLKLYSQVQCIAVQVRHCSFLSTVQMKQFTGLHLLAFNFACLYSSTFIWILICYFSATVH